MTVVLVEDSHTQAARLRLDLTAAGYQVLLAHDGPAGLELCRGLTTPPAAVVTDIIMPGMDGYELCRRLKDDPRLAAVPVIVLTELTAPADVLRAVEAGADNYCTKPYRTEILLDRLRRTIQEPPADRSGVVELDGQSFRIDGAASRLAAILLSSLSDAASRYHDLERSRQQLEKSTGEREEMMRVVAHELRGPLQTLVSTANLARLRPMADLPQRVEREARRMVRVIDDLADLSSIQLGTLRVDPRPLDLAVILRETVERLRPGFASHEIDLEFDEPLPVEADADRLQQIVTNLLSNAVKYSPEQNRIEIAARRTGPSARVSVRDFGIGIASADQARIFERYVRTDTGKQQAEGTGLGLYVCRHLVEAHGGAVGVDSELGSGSTFWFELPLRD
jgi:two-component system, sensor histidine kinase and response regulator